MALYDLLNTYGSEKVLAAIKSCLSSNLIGAEYVEATLSMNLSRVENRTCTKSAELSNQIQWTEALCVMRGLQSDLMVLDLNEQDG